MQPFTSQELAQAVTKLSREASLELHNIMLTARLQKIEELEGQQSLEVDDGTHGPD